MTSWTPDSPCATCSIFCRRRGPPAFTSATLLNKPSRRRVEVPLHFVGFEIPDRFVVGYGLDAAQKYRNLPYVAVVDG